MIIRFGYILVKSQLVPTRDAFTKHINSYTELLNKMGGEEWSSATMNNPLPLFYFMTTGGTEQSLLDIRSQRALSVPDEPVLVLAHPAYNSLPASMEVLARLHQDQAKGRIFYLKGSDDKAGFKQIENTVDDYDVYRQLKETRIGLLGSPSDWLVASSPELKILENTWGPKVVSITMEEVKESLKNISADAIPPVRDPLIEEACEVREPSKKELDDVVRVYLALKSSIEKHKLQALTLRCFDLVLDLQTTGCFGLAQLNDEGIIAGCEGDLHSTVAMLWVKKLLNQTPWMANPAQLDESTNSFWLAHCTVPRELTQSYGLRSHFESGLGVGIQGDIPPGPITLLRIGGKRMELLWLAEGDIVQAGGAEDLCRTQVEIKLSSGHVSELLTEPLGNHLVMFRGSHTQRLRSWWKTMIAEAPQSGF